MASYQPMLTSGTTAFTPTARCFTLIASAIRNGVEPFKYMRDLLTRLTQEPGIDIDELLPDRWQDKTTEKCERMTLQDSKAPELVKQAFAKVRQVLSESTYGYGDKWYVASADTRQKRITAYLRFTDDEVRLQGTSLFQVYVSKDRKHRLLELVVQMHEEPGDVTVVQFDFKTKVEGLAWYACDRAIYNVLSDIEKLIAMAETCSGA
jgi:IS66 C-terminal element